MKNKRNQNTTYLKGLFLLLFLIFTTNSFAQRLIHNFEFNGNLNDTSPTGIILRPVNLTSSSYGTNPNSFTWLQATNPGGGLSLLTDQLPDPTHYSLGFRISFKETGSGYKKILSFKGATVDNGLYFQNNNLEFYPFGKNAAVTYQPNTFYDFVLTRTPAKNIKVYVVEPNGTVTLVYDKQDASDASVPQLINGKHALRFFMDDTHTNSEHSSGGTVRGIRMWDKALTPAQIGAALSSVTTEPPINVTSTSATLVGEVNPQGSLSIFGFEYGTSTSYGTTITASPASSSGTSAISTTADISGLTKGQQYHYRIISTNSVGVSYGSDVSFFASPDHDNDGVPDINDLDDDNDGILDTVEGAKATSVGTSFNTGSGTGNVTGTLSSVSGSVTYNIAFQNVGNSGNGGIGNASDFFNAGKEISCAYTAAGSDNTFTFTPQGTATLLDLEEVTVDVSWVSTGNVITFNQALNSFALKPGTTGSISADGKTVTITSGSNAATAGFTAKLSATIVNPFVVNGRGTSNDTFTIKVAASIFDRPDSDNDGIENAKDLDSDGDGIKDVSEVYGPTYDSDNDGVFGKGIPTVDANGLVIAAGVTGNVYNNSPKDNDGNGILDIFQASQTFGGITTQPTDVSSIIDNPAVFTVDFSTTGSGTAPSVQWYTKKAGTTTEVLLTNTGIYAGVTTKTLTVTGYLPANNGDKFYAKISTPSVPSFLGVTSNEAILNVTPHTIVANDDAITIVKNKTLVISTESIVDNDLISGNKPLIQTNVILSKVGSSAVNFETIGGRILINSLLTPAGVYTVQYSICEVIDPTNCQTATVTVTVLEDTDFDGVADINDLDDDNDGILDTEEGTCTLPAQMRLGYVPNSRDLDSDDGYTIDGKNMTGLKSKIENPANFGPSGTVKTAIILVPITANPITKADLDALNLDAIFIGGIDRVPTIKTWLFSAEFSAIKTWSTDPSKTVIVTQAASTHWGRTLKTGNTNPDTPNTIGAATSVFNGPFGKVTQFNQGGSFQAIYSADPSKNDAVLALDQKNEIVIIKDGVYNDILISDVDILTSIGGITNGSSIVNDNDKLAMNLIYTAIPLSSCPGTDIDLDGVSNSLDLDSDGDGCNDVTEAYGLGNDADGDGIFGTGTPTVDADGKVVGASYGAPADVDTNGTADYRQTSQKINGITTQPISQLDKSITDTVSFTVVPDISGTGTAFVYQWEEKKQGAASWTPITDGANYAGSTTRTLTVSNLKSTQNGDLFRAKIATSSYVCDSDITSSSAQLTIKSHDIVLGADPVSFVEKGTGQVIANILSNDLINGIAATPTNATITLLSSSISGLTLNTTTGEVTTDGTLIPGVYTLDYQLCEIADPTNCTTSVNKGVITVTILKDSDGDLVADVNDLDDDNDGILDTVEDAINADADSDGIINSLDTDSDNDGCSDTKEVYGATTDFGINPTVDANGLVTAAGVTGATYTTLPTDNDSNGTNDFIQASKAATGFSTQPKDHLTNINKSVIFKTVVNTSGTGTDVTYQWQVQVGGVGAWTNITDNANYAGATTSLLTVTPTNDTFNGNTYRTIITTPSYVCDSDLTSSQALLIVNSHIINANSDSASLVEQKAATNIVNVITNDFVNHIAASIADLNLTQISTSNAGISLNTATGAVDMTAAVTEGIYFLQYQICEKIDPTNCASGSVTIVVQKDTDLDGLPDSTDPDIDNDGNLNGTDSNPYLPVANNDTATVKVGQATEVDLLSNDDFLPGANTTITSTGGTAAGTIAFNNLTGKLTYTPTLAEAGKDVTVIYEVTNTATSVKKSATVLLSVNDEADISLAMQIDNATPNVGATVVFTITATNNGPSNATNVDVKSKLSTGYTFVSATASAGTYDAVTGNWFVGAINNGVSPTLAITATVNATGEYTQTAEVAFADQSDPDSFAGNGNTSEDDYATTSATPVAQANLITILSVDNATPNEGDDITYQIRVTNNGPSDASNVQITSATIPTGITYKSDDGSGDYINGTGVWTIGNLAKGSSTTLHIIGTVNTGQSGNSINTTIVRTLTETDPTATGDNLSVGITVNQAALTTTIAVDNATPNEGDTVKYTINIANGGPNSVTGIELTSILPSGVTYVSDNGAGTYNSATGIWNPTTLANGANTSLEITAIVNSGTAGTTISNAVTKISTDQSTSNTLPVSAANLTVKSINLVTTNTVDNATPNEGSTIKYTLSVTNSGTDTATNVVVTDLLPTGVTYVSDNGGGNYVSGTGIWTVGSIANGVTQSLEITATVNGGTAGSHITNTISSITSTETDISATGDVLASGISVTSANLVTVLNVGSTIPNVNAAAVYTITVTNNGPGNATGVTLTNLVPSGLTFVSSNTTNASTYTVATGLWAIGNIASGASATLTVNTTVNANQGNQTITINTTAASGNQTDSTTTGDVLTQSIKPTSANLISTISVNNPTPNENATIIYTISVKNAGPSNETNVSLTNTIPTGITYVSDDGGGAYNSVTGVWTIGSIPAGTTKKVNITATVNSGTGSNSINNIITAASGDQVDLDSNGDQLTALIQVTSADLLTHIKVNNATPNIGQNIVFTIDVTNNGPNNETNTSLTSLIPSGLTFVSSTVSAGVYNAGSGLWTIGSIAKSTTQTLTITASVNSGQGGATITQSTTAAIGDQTDPTTATDVLTVIVQPISINLVTVLSLDNSVPNEGSTIKYTIDVSNVSGTDATAVTLTDALPSGLTYVSDNGSGAYVSGTGVWTIGSLNAGASTSLEIMAIVNASTSGSIIVNTSTAATATQTDTSTIGDVLSQSLTVTNSNLITVQSVDNPTPNVNTNVVYTIVVSNSGASNHTGVSLTDLLPSGVSYLNHTASQGTYANGTGVWTIGDVLTNSSVTLAITASVDSNQGGQTITNSTSAAKGTEADISTVGDTLDAVINVTSANLVTVMSVDNSNPNIGGQVKYTLSVTNNGPATENNIKLTDKLPVGLTFVSSNPSTGSYNSSTGVWSLGTLSSLASASLEITATVDTGQSGNTITNTTTAANGNQTDPTTTGDVLSTNILVTTTNLISTISVDKLSPNEGETITYTIVVRNAGPSNETNTKLTDLLPTGVTYTGSSPSQGTYVSGTGVWTIGSITNGATATLTITATVDSATGGSTITNTMTAASGDVLDLYTNGDQLSAAITVENAKLLTTLTVNNTTPNENGTVIYTYTVVNNGPSTDRNISLTSVLPAGLTLISSNPSQGTYNAGGASKWNIGNLAKNTTATLTVTATVNSATGGNTITTTTTKATGDHTDSGVTGHVLSAPITVSSTNLVTSISIDNTVPNVGNTVVYTINIANISSTDATSVKLTNLLPSGITYVSNTASIGTYTSSTGIWNIGTVAKSTNETLTISATINAGTLGNTITNTISSRASGDQTDSTNTGDVLSVDLTVSAADLVTTIAVNNPSPNVGDQVEYTISVINNGGLDDTNVSLTDNLPAGVTYVSHTASQGSFVSGTGIWTIGSILNTGKATLKIIASINSDQGGQTITNTTGVATGDIADPTTNGDVLNASLSVTSANLVTILTVDNSNPNIGDTINYTINVTNNGPSDETNVSLTNALPTGVTFVSATTASGAYVSGTGVWTLGSLTKFTTASLVIQATVNTGTGGSTISSTTTAASGDQVDPTTNGDSLQANILVATANLITTLNVDNPTPNEGDIVTYTLNVRNAGPNNETGISLTNLLPTGVTFTGSTPSQGTYVSGTGVWTIGALTNGSSTSLTITATVNANTAGTGTITSTTSAASGLVTDPDTSGDDLTADISVLGAKLLTNIIASNSTPNEGDTVTYTITVTNNGPTNDENTSLTSLIPSGLTFVSASASQGTFTSGTGVWSIGNIANGNSATLTVTATVNANTGGTAITVNTTSANGDHTDSSVTAHTLSTVMNVTSVNLVTSISVDNPVPNEGNTIKYTINVSNISTTNATNVSLTNVLPSGVTIVGNAAVSQGNYIPGSGVWTIGSIAKGSNASIVITATIDGGTIGTVITNSTTVAAGDQSDISAAGDVLSVPITITGSNLITVKTVNNTSPNIGDTVEYTIVVSNNGPSSHTNVVLTDNLPSGVTLSGTPTVTKGTFNTTTKLWSIGTIASNSNATLKVLAIINADQGGKKISSTITPASSDEADVSTIGDILTASLTVTSANLVTTLSLDNSNPNIGDTVKYTIHVTNNGPGTETNVSLIDMLPAGLTFTTATASQGTYTNSSGLWTIGSINAFSTANIVIEATVNTGQSGNSITNTITQTATGDQTDPTTSGDILSQSLAVTSANLITAISVDNTSPNESDTVIYTVTVTNNGPSTESNITLSSLVPTGINFVSGLPSQGSYSSSTGLWSIGSLNATNSTTLTLIGTVSTGTGGTTITTNTTAAKGNIPDNITSGDNLSVAITVTKADLVTVISVDNPTPNEGDTVTYTIKVSNNGPNNETNASLNSILPTGVTYVSSVATRGTYNPSSGAWSIGNISLNSEETLTINAKVDANTGGTTISKTTTAATGNQTDTDTTGDVLSTSITIGNYADIVLGKTVDKATPNAGDTINYTISVTNNGPANVTNLVISDVLPTGLTFVNEFAGTGTWNTSLSTWTLAALASGDTKNLIIQATVNTDQGGNTITNIISNTQTQTDSNATVDDNSATIVVTDTDLFSTIAVDNASPNEGDTVKYSITITNKSGSSTATNVSLTDVLPVGVTFVSSSTTNGTYNSGSGLWNVGNLMGGASALLIIDAKVNNGTGGTTITNTTSNLSADQSDSNTTADTLAASITVTSTDLVTTKTVDVPNPTEGQDIIYTITVTNNAGNNATNVQLTDRLPAGVTYKSDDSGSYNSTSGIWTIGSIIAGASKTINITATVATGTGNTTITNTTSAAKGDQSDPTTVGDDLIEVINVVSANLVTENSVNVVQANIGDTVTYSLKVTNNGPSTANAITLIDKLPSGVSYVSDSSSGTYVAATGVWTIGALANGASATINIVATVDSNSGGKSITNVISQAANGTEVDPTTANDILSSSFKVISNDLETSLTVDKANPNEGDTVIYTLKVKNNGPSTATGVSITDNLPSGVTYVNHSSLNGTFNSGAGIWTIGSLAKNATATLTINGKIDVGTGGQTLVNTTSAVTADFNDQNTANNSDTASLIVGNLADVVVTNTVDNSVPNVGDTVTFTVTVTNNGPTKVSTLNIANNLPNGLTYGLVTPSNGTWTSSNWAIGGLDSGKTETLTILATVNAGTGGQHLTNTVSNTQTQTDSNVTSDDFDETITVTSADLVTAKTVSNANPNEGDTIMYTISVTNNGPNDATNVSLTDLLPSGVTYVSDDASGSYNTGSGLWSIGTITNGTTVKLNISVSVNNGTGGTSIVNVATKAVGDQTDPTTSGDDLTETIMVSSSELVTTLSVDNSNPLEGDIITYSITVNNQGSSNATNVSLTSNLPNNLTFDSFITPSGTAFNQGSGIWIVGNMASHTSKVLQVKAKVNIGTGGTTITNSTSAAKGDQSDPNLVPDILSKDIVISNASDILVTKTVDNATPNVGDTVTYTITVENKSGARINNFVLTDALPNGLTFGTVTSTKGTWISPNWSIATLDVNEIQTLTVNAIVNAGTGGLSLTNTVRHTQNQTDSNTTPDDLSETVVVTSSDLVTLLSVNNSTPNEGDTIVYTLQVLNNGPSDATGINVIENLPTGVTYVNHTVTSGVYNTGSGQWNGLSLTNGNSATLTITAMVNSGTGGTKITNTTSTAIGNQSDPSTSGDVTSVDINVTSSNLVTVKTVNKTTPNEGDTIVYTIQVTNNGPSDATNVSLIDQLPTGVTYVSDDAGGDFNATTGIWNVGNIANTGIKTLNITAVVKAGSGGTTVTNTSTAAKGDQSDPTTVGDSLTAAINVTISNLVTTISVDNATPNERDNIIYSILVVNNGPNDATNVVLTDLLPTGVTFVSDDGSGAYNSGNGVWSLGSVSFGTTHRLKITANVDAGTGGTTIINTTSVAKGSESDPTTSGDVLAAVINVTSSDLITKKTVTTIASGGNAFEGEVIKYTISVTNNGISNATNVSLTDNLPVGVTYRSHSVSDGIYNIGSGYWSIGNIANNNTVTLIVNASVDSGQGGNTITNTTSKAVGDQSDPTTLGDDLSAVITVANSSDIVLTKVVDNKNPNEGDIITYTITVTNKNGAAVTNLVVTDALPSGLTYDSAITSIGTWTSPNWNIGSLAPGKTETILIKAKVNNGTLGLTLTNTVSNTQDQIDSNLTQDDNSETISVTNSDLEVVKTVSNQAPLEGEAIIYTIKVKNNGPNDATGVVITDILPNGVSYVGHFTNEGTYNQGSGLWTIGGVLNGATATLTINVTVDAGTTHNNITNTTSNLRADQADPNTSNNIGSVTITPGSTIDLSLTKKVVGNNLTPKIGDVISYEIIIKNSGQNAASGIEVKDLLPSGLEFVRYNSSSAYDTVTGIWSVGSLVKNDTKILFLEVKVLANGDYTNCTEVIKADQIDADSTPNNGIATEDDYACISIMPVSIADLELKMTVNQIKPLVNSNVEFLLTLTNKGPSNATNVSVTNLLPSGYTFASSNATLGNYDDVTGVWNVGTIATSSNQKLTITATVLNIGDWLNKAEVTASNELDPDSTPNNSDVDEDDYAEVSVSPNIVVSIPQTFSPNGDNINETFEIPNIQVEYPRFSISIVNRYGYKVFTYTHNGNPNSKPISWNGTSSGNINVGSGVLPAGTYFYTIHFNDGNRKPQTGWVYLRK